MKVEALKLVDISCKDISIVLDCIEDSGVTIDRMNKTRLRGGDQYSITLKGELLDILHLVEEFDTFLRE